MKKDPSICPHGTFYPRCEKQECMDELCRAEDAATCIHGFLTGCPGCRHEVQLKVISRFIGKEILGESGVMVDNMNPVDICFPAKIPTNIN